MTELQKKSLDMLSFFHGLCENERLRYFLVGGSALGAARHGGFIPWDDDIDVGMPRCDYEKLRKATKGKLFGKYLFEFPSEDITFVYPYGKMYDTSTTLTENSRYRTTRGIFIDIFPLDGIGNTYSESLENFRAIRKKVDMLSAKTSVWRRGRRLYKNLAGAVARLVPELILSQTELKRKIKELSQRLDFDSCVYVANVCGNWREKEISERKWFGNPKECTFEGIKAYIPEKADEYLTSLYGNWRTPPPLELQITHHGYLILDLNEPYIKNKADKRK